jgi:hypothetical protein
MAKFKLEIELGNAAMLTGDDVANALLQVAREVRDSDPRDRDGPIFDENKYRVGEWRFTR